MISKYKNIIASVIIIIVAVAGYGALRLYQDQVIPLDPTPTPTQGKLNINAICEGALAYSTFADSASAELFVQECKEGKHPEVIEAYKKQLNLGDGAAI